MESYKQQASLALSSRICLVRVQWSSLSSVVLRADRAGSELSVAASCFVAEWTPPVQAEKKAPAKKGKNPQDDSSSDDDEREVYESDEDNDPFAGMSARERRYQEAMMLKFLC